jgi:molybdate transport system ATP-binding protein
MNHVGIYLSNAVNKDLLIDRVLSNALLRNEIDLAGLHGELYSTLSISRLIDEELRHDRFSVFTKENASLLSMSSGQQRKALLDYIVARKPQYIVIDDVYSSVDSETQHYIIESIHQLATSTLLIQIFYRKKDFSKSDYSHCISKKGGYHVCFSSQ